MSLQVEDGDILGSGENTLEETRVDRHGGVGVVVRHQYEGGEGREPVLGVSAQPGGVGEPLPQLQSGDGGRADDATPGDGEFPHGWAELTDS